MGALTGYARSSYGHQICLLPGGGTYVCSGSSSETQDLTLKNNAQVSTDPNGFDVDTTAVGGSGGNAISITGDGAISYTDANMFPLTATDTALYVQSNGDDGATPGSVTVNTNGALTGGDYGIFAVNVGSGALDITANGNVEGTTENGIYARNEVSGADLSVTTGVGTKVIGDDRAFTPGTSARAR
jgi:hypothetical protein